MGAEVRRSIMRNFILLACALAAISAVSLAQKKNAAPAEDWLRGVTTRKTSVVDLTYAINDKLPAWPGDAHVFEAKINATAGKDGYFTRSFWMLEHYGTHMDAPAHFPPGKLTVDEIPTPHLFGPAVVIDV